MADQTKRPFPPDSWPAGREVQVSPRWLGVGALGFLLFLAVWSAFFTVPAESEAVVMRFGRFESIAPSGLHFKLPFGIDRVQILPVRRQLKQEFGFSTSGNINPSQSTGPQEQRDEKAMVTGDLNAAQVEWVIQYRIEDPKKYLFN
ncbi:MAG TPA: SPFH domain-containing protein, partial [Planctomycetota bacterium]|nr:SPFH domain-containing protein [Planctomycetota bacterium]